ncbi:UDP-glycosyltransferase 85A7 [Morus notabilis]|uniref:Glycosyltransferase n=1 Tax=Morus notabilis TaxID=981085 RepID=W9SKW3_9ROSA|nr:7-deoxyloganetin glucosyltransferase [Morus notabilis]EXC33352.1 UDP-glycosyltransferase 85A7 [Morus notabilis]
MGSLPEVTNKPHAVCIPHPTQGHINPMLNLAKLLHRRGFHITFVNTEFNHKRMLNSRRCKSLDISPDFRFEAIPDGLPPPPAGDDDDAVQHVPELCESIGNKCLLEPLRKLLAMLNEGRSSNGFSTVIPPVSCIVSDGIMTFTIEAAEELGIPVALFWTASACGFIAYKQYWDLVEKGLIPLKDESYLRNGYLDNPIIDWIPGIKEIRLRDSPSFYLNSSTNANEHTMMKFFTAEIEATSRASAIIINTFDALEDKVLEALKVLSPPLYTVGPIHEHWKMAQQNMKSGLSSVGFNLWKEQDECLQWLNSKQPRSVLYVNFGSVAFMTSNCFQEFAWGLANSGKPFIWIVRPDLVVDGDSALLLSQEFLEETRGRGFVVTWCPQEQVLSHPSVGGFLTHCGWNSTLEALSAGVPMICRPFLSEQPTNCRFLCTEWGVGFEIEGGDVKRDQVEKVVKELMEGERGEEMRKKAVEWKREAEEAIAPGGSSWLNFDKMVKEVLTVSSSKP